MHELYLAECIFNGVLKSLPEDIPSTSVADIRVRVGKLDAVIPETLTFLFNAIREEQGFPQSRLSLEEEDVQCQCQNCRSEFAIYEPLFVCPHCGSSQISVTAGRGLTILEILVKDEDNDAHSDIA